MRGDPEVIETLNDVLTAELTAINQYFIHAKMCQNWGYAKLAARKRAESIEEMHHADRVIDRILFLDGVPNMQRLFSVKVGERYKDLKRYRPQEWNELVVTVMGGVARAEANGELLEAAIPLPATGPIGLEGDRGQMEYRRIRIKPLSD